VFSVQAENNSRMGEAWSLGHGALSQSLRNQLSDGASAQIKIASRRPAASRQVTGFRRRCGGAAVAAR
jgi:hypothetical protein